MSNEPAATALLPVATLLIGLFFGLLADYFRHRFQWQREDAARREGQHNEQTQKHFAFQRETLLGLQEAVFDVTRFAARAYQEDCKHERETGDWKNSILSNSVDEGFRLSARQCALLSSRVANVQVRELEKELREKLALGLAAPSREKADNLNKEVSERFIALNELIGAVLRLIDHSVTAGVSAAMPHPTISSSLKK